MSLSLAVNGLKRTRPYTQILSIELYKRDGPKAHGSETNQAHGDQRVPVICWHWFLLVGILEESIAPLYFDSRTQWAGRPLCATSGRTA